MLVTIRKCIRNEKGGVSVISSIGLGAALLATILSIDVGYMFMVENELQNAADAAALAAVTTLPVTQDEASQYVNNFATAHFAGGNGVVLDGADVELGRYDFTNRVFLAGQAPINSARVTARRATGIGSGSLVLFMANALGVRNNIDLFRTAVAAADPRVVGVDGGHLIPYTVHESLIDENNDGQPDVGRRVDLPLDKNEPGQFGWLDLDGGSNDTPELRDYIEHGFDQTFEIPQSGHLDVFGSTGIEGQSVKPQLDSIAGKSVIIPVFSSSNAQGNGATYRIVDLIAINVDSVRLTGNPDNRAIVADIVNSVSSGLIVREGESETGNLQKLRLVE